MGATEYPEIYSTFDSFDDNELTPETEAILAEIDADVRRRDLDDLSPNPGRRMVRQWDLAAAQAEAMARRRGEL